MIHDLDHLVGRTTRLGILINILTPGVIAAIVFVLVESEIVHPNPEFADRQPVLFFADVAVALGELVAAFVLRRILFSPDRARPIRHDSSLVEQWVQRSSVVIFALGATPLVYGAILYLLSGDIRQLALFGIISLLAYRLFRPTRHLLEGALNEPSSQ